jgi:F-type H+-transporting ATPase subunit b
MRRLAFNRLRWRQKVMSAAWALGLLAVLLRPASGRAQEQPAPAPANASTESPKAEPTAQKSADHKSFGGELAEQTREATGADEEEEHADLKHSSVVQWLARKTGLTVHQAHLTALGINFAIVAIVIVWTVRKFVPGMLRARSAAIQHALEEARAASQDANRRLSEIENRLRQLDVEIGQMQAAAEKEADAEERRIQTAAEEDIQKVVASAEREIAEAAKQARRELSAHTAGLALTLARQQIHVDANTDQVLVRTFAEKLAPRADSGKDGQ